MSTRTNAPGYSRTTLREGRHTTHSRSALSALEGAFSYPARAAKACAIAIAPAVATFTLSEPADMGMPTG